MVIMAKRKIYLLQSDIELLINKSDSDTEVSSISDNYSETFNADVYDLEEDTRNNRKLLIVDFLCMHIYFIIVFLIFHIISVC